MEPIKIELPDIMNESMKPLAQSIGNTLSSIWTMCFGWVDISAEKVQYKRQLSLQAFKAGLEQEISKIPEDNLCEPKLSVVGPALEASKYFFEEESLRTMFAKLIANSMNKETADYVHAAFVELIKQMSSVDAYFLSTFDPEGVYPIVRIKRPVDDGSGAITVIPYLYYDEVRTDSCFEENAVSLINLQRLGLIDISFDEHLVNEAHYARYVPKESADYQMKKGIFRVTPYGASFIKACL